MQSKKSVERQTTSAKVNNHQRGNTSDTTDNGSVNEEDIRIGEKDVTDVGRSDVEDTANLNNVDIDMEPTAPAAASTSTIRDWSHVRGNIKKRGLFKDNCPRYPEDLLACTERRVQRPSSTALSELYYNSEVVVYRCGNVAQIMFDVEKKSVMKSAFTADVCIFTHLHIHCCCVIYVNSICSY